VALQRDPFSFERVALRATDVPSGVRASFAANSLFGFDGLTTTLTIRTAPGLSPGSHHLTVVGDEHGNRHEATATFLVTGAPVPPLAIRDTPPRGVTESAPTPPRTAEAGSAGSSAPTGATNPPPRTATAPTGGDATGTPHVAGSVDVAGESGPSRPAAVAGVTSPVPSLKTSTHAVTRTEVIRPLDVPFTASARAHVRIRSAFDIAC
jgi:hypothetical protein